MKQERISPIEFARLQRACANTYEELLWQLLRNRKRKGMKFRRQHPLGIYTLDFYCAEAALDIEIDGTHHFTEQGKAYDAARDRWMNSQGIEVLRFSGKEVEFETESVLCSIDAALEKRLDTGRKTR